MKIFSLEMRAEDMSSCEAVVSLFIFNKNWKVLANFNTNIQL